MFIKELRLLGRSLNSIVSALVLILTFTFIFHYSVESSFSRSTEGLENIYIGMKWTFIFLVAFVYIGQSIWEERESGASTINELYIRPWQFFLVKSGVIFMVLSLVSLFTIFAFYLFFEYFAISTDNFYIHLIYLLPGMLSLAFLGVMLGLVSLSSRLKEILLPLLLIPFSIPVLIFGMGAEKKYWTSPDLLVSFIVMLAFAVFYGAMGSLLYEISSE